MRRIEAHFLQPGDVIEVAGRPFAVRSKLLEGSRVVTDVEYLGDDHDGSIGEVDWHWDEPVRRLRRGPSLDATVIERPVADVDVDDGLGL